MGVGASIILAAIGAILLFAVDADLEAIDLDMVGIILLVIGIAGLIWSLVVAGTYDRPVVTRRRGRYLHDDNDVV